MSEDERMETEEMIIEANGKNERSEEENFVRENKEQITAGEVVEGRCRESEGVDRNREKGRRKVYRLHSLM